MKSPTDRSTADPPLSEDPLSDEAVVARVREGDVALYEVLMRRHNQRMYRAVRSILRNEGEVDDVLQDAYLSAFEHLDGFDGRARFSTWLVRIAVNKALDRHRRAARVVGLDGWPEDELLARMPESPERRNPEAMSSARELTRLLQDAIDILPAAFRSVYMLREVEGLSVSETADCLDLEAATVKTRLHRARARLRDELERRAGTSARETFCFGSGRCDGLVEAVFKRLGSSRGRP